MSRFEGQVALVTGAARGIGRAVAARLAAEGARVFAVDLDVDRVQQTAAELSVGRSPIEAIAGDVSRREDVQRMVQTCVDRAGRLDVLVSNAGIADVQPLLEIDDRSWQRILA